MGPPPAVAAVRSAVRRTLGDSEPGDLVLVACSGGADSLALAAALAFEAPKLGVLAGGVTVDHGLQSGSAGRADDAAEVMRKLGLDPVEVRTVPTVPTVPQVEGGRRSASVATTPVDRSGGPEAAARRVRYAELDGVIQRRGAVACLLGHTRDDQAETVLLGLARGSGARSLAGMPARSDPYRRPLLDLPRAVTVAACAAQGLVAWDDPHNADPAFARARVRHRVLPMLERELGPGIAEALARTARQLRDDADLLDEWAGRAYGECRRRPDGGLALDDLRALPTAIRRRVLRRAALQAGCPGTDLFAVHVEAIDDLLPIGGSRTGAGLDLPGGVRVRRDADSLRFLPARLG